MKRNEVYICLDCEEIFIPARKGATCPECTSMITLPLARWVPSIKNGDFEAMEAATDIELKTHTGRMAGMVVGKLEAEKTATITNTINEMIASEKLGRPSIWGRIKQKLSAVRNAAAR